MNKKISVVVPVFNEENAVAKLHKEIKDIINGLNCAYEIIFINDGSTDKTMEALENLSPIKIIKFRKNFGQTAALNVGIKESQGEYIITMDGDGQNNPADIPNLIKKLETENLDVISGWRKKRRDSFSKRMSSLSAALLRRVLINDGIHDSGCTLKIYKKECFENTELTGEMHRFIPALLKIKGFKIGEMEVNHRPRTTGKTKYNWTRGIKGALDMLSIWFWKKYANRPLHLFGGIGILLIFVSIISGGWAIYEKIFFNQDLSNTALTNLAIFGFLMGVQFFISGLLADILSKNYYASTKDKPYNIEKIIEK